MSVWRTARLDELGTVERGRSRHRPRNAPHLYGGSHPFVQTGDIKAAGLRLYNYEQTYSDAGLAQSRLWPIGTLCITIAANIGDTAILGVPACFPDSIVGFTAFDGVADPVFVKYLLDVAKQRFAAISRGATQDNLSLDKLLSQSFSIPPLAEQRRIAAILGAYDDLIEVNRRRVVLLEDMARGQFEEWFVRFQFPGHEDVARVNTPEGSIPQGWASGVLGDLVELRKDITGPGDHLENRKYIPIECIGKRTLMLAGDQPWREAQSSLQLFERGDILFGAMRAYFHKVAPAPMPGVTRSTCFVLRPRQQYLWSYSLLTLFRDETVEYASTHSRGSTIPYAHWKGSLEKLACPIPSQALLEKFERTIRPAIEHIMGTFRSTQLLSASRDLLLPRLISGQLSVAAAERELSEVA